MAGRVGDVACVGGRSQNRRGPKSVAYDGRAGLSALAFHMLSGNSRTLFSRPSNRNGNAVEDDTFGDLDNLIW